MFSLIGRMVLFDLIKVAFLSLLAVTAVLTLGGAMLAGSRQGLEPLAILAMLPLLIPPTLPYTLPSCLLFACTFVFSRLSCNQEVVALKAGGVNAARIFAPAFALGVIVAGTAYALTDRAIPWCNRKFAEMILADIQSAMLSYIRNTGEIVLPEFPYEIYVNDVRGDRLMRPIFKHRGPHGSHDLVAMAEEATLAVQLDSSGNLDEAQVILALVDGVVCSTRQDGSVHFEKKAFAMPMPPLAKLRDEKLERSTNSQCLERSRMKQSEAAAVQLDFAWRAANAMLAGAVEASLTDEAATAEHADRHLRKSREAVAEVHIRTAQSVIALGFVCVGCPIGVLFQRRDFLHTFFLCFLPVITFYYPLMILAFNVYKECAWMTPMVLWIPGALVLAASAPFLKRVIRF